MPLTASGPLAIVASSDLGALGQKQGLPVAYNWVLPSLAPLLLPWLLVLGLLALKPNRRAAAWWIWLPAGCLLAFTQAPVAILPAGTNFLLDIIAALAAGLAAVWLLSNYLRRPNRFVSFLCVWLALVGFSALAFLSLQGGTFTIETLQVGIVLALGVLVTAAALSLGGLICRGRYRPLALYAWLLLSLAVVWLLVATPLFAWLLRTSAVGFGWNVFFAVLLIVAALHFAVLLPFLILSSASPFFRQRLKDLLHVKPDTAPVLPPVPEAILKS